MTVATWIIGLFEILMAIGLGYLAVLISPHYWYPCGYTLVMSGLFVLTAIFHRNVMVRAILYWTYFYSAIAAAVLISVAIIIIGVRDYGKDRFEEFC